MGKDGFADEQSRTALRYSSRDLLLDGTMRFKEPQRSIGKVSQKVLASNLRTMEDAGLVHREVFAAAPPRVGRRLQGAPAPW